MNPHSFSRLLRKHKIRRRAVVRTIDFLVSFTLFIIFLTQFYVIIINMNLNLASTSTKQENPAELFSNKLVGLPGSQNWGTLTGSPSSFGLASDSHYTNLGSYVDLAKLGRLNSDLQYLPINSTYSYIDPQVVVNNFTGSISNIAFRLSTRPPIQVLASETHTTAQSTLTIQTATWNNVSLDNINVDIFYVQLSNGSVAYSNTVSTGTSGQTVFTTPILRTNYVAIAYAYSLDNWGIGWVEVQNDLTNTLSASNLPTFLQNSPYQDINSILQVTNNTLPSVTPTIRTTTAYLNSSQLLNTSVFSNTSSITRNLTDVGTNTPVIQVYTMNSGSIDYYRVVTEPLVFNNVNYTSTTYSSYQFPVYQTPNFSTVDLSTIYSYTTTVMTDRGPLLLTLDLSTG